MRLNDHFPELPAQFRFKWRDIDFTGSLRNAPDGIAISLRAEMPLQSMPGVPVPDGAALARVLEHSSPSHRRHLTIDQAGRLSWEHTSICSGSPDRGLVLEYIALAALRAGVVMTPIREALRINVTN